MRNWRIVVATVLILGLAALPSPARADADDAGDGTQEMHHTGDHPHTHKGMKKAAETKSATKKTDSTTKEETSEHPQDGHGVQGNSLDDIEGSH